MKIRAALSEHPDRPFVIADVDLDEPRRDEILVRVMACGICHTDLLMRGRWPLGQSPMVFGHEGAGVVEAVGADVVELSPGDRVVMTFRSCGACLACTSGKIAYCQRNRLMNFSGGRPDGTVTMHRGGRPVHGSFFGQSSFATHVLATERNAVRVPPATDLALAAPLGCGVQTGAGAVMNALRPGANDALVVFGVGGVGAAAIMAAAAGGVEAIIAVEPVPDRRAVALEIGATAAIDPVTDDVVACVRDHTGVGATHGLDTTGKPTVINTALEALAINGTLALVTSETPDLSIGRIPLFGGGRAIRGVTEGDATPHTFVPELLRMHASGRFPLDRIVRVYPFDRINEACRDAATGVAIKPVLTFPGGDG